MEDKLKQMKDQKVIFRASRAAVKSLDVLAKVMGANRSEALRRLIPDLSPERKEQRCAG